MTEETLAGGADALELREEDQGQTLVAIFHPSCGDPLDETTLRRAVCERGFDQIPLIDAAIGAFIARQADSESFAVVIGGNRDAEIHVEIDNDLLAAYVRVTPSVGDGRPLSRDWLLHALREADVVEGVLAEAIDQVLLGAHAPVMEWGVEGPRILVAHGREPRHGEDGRLESLLPNVADRRPREREDGRVDYRDMGEVTVVHPGTAFVRALPPTPGEDGLTVTGEVLPARQGRPITLKPIDQSTEISADDPDVLIARITGQPVILAAGAKIEPIFRVNEVGISSGNVIFDGSVVVKGDVQGGMKIEAGGDIKVGGVVEGATLIAGGDVVISGGIIGQGKVRDAQGRIRSEAASVRAGGLVSARFIDNAFVEAGGDVLVRDLVRHSEVSSASRVLVGGGSRGKGQIIGGLTKARHLIQTAVLGAAASVHTVVEVGDRAELKRRMREVEGELREQQVHLQKIERTLKQAMNNQGADKKTPAKAEQARQRHLDHIERLKAEGEKLRRELVELKKAQIVAGKKVFTNVQVIIDGKNRSVVEERNSVTFVVEGMSIEFR